MADIVSVLAANQDVARGLGLYVGCGNGRNYLPLVDAGLDIIGLDLSPEAIKQLAGRRPAVAWRLMCADFTTFDGAERPFDFLIAIQVFQHGGDADVRRYFDRAARLLRPGGLFFLRVNSAATEVYHVHTVTDRNPLGGLTVRYEAGPKRGLLVHFYSRAELTEHLSRSFTPVMPLREDIIVRAAPKTGSWAQWEGVWRRSADLGG